MRLPSIAELVDAAYDAGVEFDPAFMPNPAAVAAANALRGIRAIDCPLPPSAHRRGSAAARGIVDEWFEASDLREPIYRAFV